MKPTKAQVAALRNLDKHGGARPCSKWRCSDADAGALLDARLVRGALAVLGGVWAELTPAGRAALDESKP